MGYVGYQCWFYVMGPRKTRNGRKGTGMGNGDREFVSLLVGSHSVHKATPADNLNQTF